MGNLANIKLKLSLSQMLRIHPLTLEDILHQEPREKLELFPKLGYYFVIFRALEGEQAREQFRRYWKQEDGQLPGASIDDGVFTGVNVYLLVFKDGIVTVCDSIQYNIFAYAYTYSLQVPFR